LRGDLSPMASAMRSTLPIQVLLIDDLRAITIPLADLLRKRGYRAEAVNDSRLALEAVRRLRPDVILLDINMPYLDGYQVAESVRTDTTTHDIPIIAVTSNENEVHLQRSRAAGICYQLTKPCDIRELTAIIDRVVHPAQN
jgi:two-component system NtrC family sensor kinase